MWEDVASSSAVVTFATPAVAVVGCHHRSTSSLRSSPPLYSTTRTAHPARTTAAIEQRHHTFGFGSEDFFLFEQKVNRNSHFEAYL